MEDISNIIKELSDIFSSNDIPDNLKQAMSSISNSNSSEDTDENSNSNLNQNIQKNFDINEERKNTNNNDFNIDINMIFKLKQIFDQINTKEDPRKSLLLSLKPYLKDNKKEKIDKYIKFLNIAKIIEIIGPDILGSDNNV